MVIDSTGFAQFGLRHQPSNVACAGAVCALRDTLKKLFKLSPYVIGAEKIYVNKNYGGASIPCEDSLTISKLGMTVCDSTIFVGWGYRPTRGRETRENHINFIDTLGMKRSAQP